MPIINPFPLLVLLFAGHWAADYTKLSRPYMLAAKRIGSPIGPIAAHAFIHAVMVFMCIAAIAPCVDIDSAWRLVAFACLIEFLTHWVIDIFKGRINVWFPSVANPANPYHWYVFGADQTLHAYVLIFIAYLFYGH